VFNRKFGVSKSPIFHILNVTCNLNQPMKKRILITIIGVLIIGIGYFGIEMFEFAKGVKADIPKNIEYFKKNKTVKLIESKTEKELDTMNIDNYNIIFFHPNEMEFEELLKEYGKESEGLYEVDSDFGFYVNKVYDSISKTDLKVRIITERIIKYSTKSGVKYLDRLKNEEHPYGIIFNSVECEPKMEFGVITDIGFYQVLAEYKKNCK
jgi:predicted RND superfamily exporter protein